MSNQILLEAQIPGCTGPLQTKKVRAFQFMQDRYRKGPFKKKPITFELLSIFAEELDGHWFNHVTITPDFVTSDGTTWAAELRFMEKATAERFKVFTYRLLFPKADDATASNGTVSDQHIALYVEGDIVPSERRIRELLMTLNHLLTWDFSNFYLSYE